MFHVVPFADVHGLGGGLGPETIALSQPAQVGCTTACDSRHSNTQYGTRPEYVLGHRDGVAVVVARIERPVVADVASVSHHVERVLYNLWDVDRTTFDLFFKVLLLEEWRKDPIFSPLLDVTVQPLVRLVSTLL